MILAGFAALGARHHAGHAGQFDPSQILKGVVTAVGTRFGLLSLGYGVLGHGGRMLE